MAAASIWDYYVALALWRTAHLRIVRLIQLVTLESFSWVISWRARQLDLSGLLSCSINRVKKLFFLLLKQIIKVLSADHLVCCLEGAISTRGLLSLLLRLLRLSFVQTLMRLILLGWSNWAPSFAIWVWNLSLKMMDIRLSKRGSLVVDHELLLLKILNTEVRIVGENSLRLFLVEARDNNLLLISIVFWVSYCVD